MHENAKSLFRKHVLSKFIFFHFLVNHEEGKKKNDSFIEIAKLILYLNKKVKT